MSGADDIFSRWSRRRRAVAEEAAARARPDAPATDAAPPAEKGAPATDEAPRARTDPPETEAELLDRLGLKPPEELQPGDDFAAYMQAAVPEALRRRALRVLWRSNPVLACVDGLNDYDGDYTGGGVPAGQLRTAYKVGRGLLDQAARAPADDDEAAPDADAEAAEAAEAGDGDTGPQDESGPQDDSGPADAQPGREHAPPARRRMVFRAPPAPDRAKS